MTGRHCGMQAGRLRQLVACALLILVLLCQVLHCGKVFASMHSAHYQAGDHGSKLQIVRIGYTCGQHPHLLEQFHSACIAGDHFARASTSLSRLSVLSI